MWVKESETFNEIESYFSKIKISRFFYPSRTVYFVYKFRILWFENFRNSPIKAISIERAVSMPSYQNARSNYLTFIETKFIHQRLQTSVPTKHLRQNRTLIDNDVYINNYLLISWDNMPNIHAAHISSSSNNGCYKIRVLPSPPLGCPIHSISHPGMEVWSRRRLRLLFLLQ